LFFAYAIEPAAFEPRCGARLDRNPGAHYPGRARAFAKQGYAAATTQTIAQRAGVTEKTLAITLARKTAFAQAIDPAMLQVDSDRPAGGCNRTLHLAPMGQQPSRPGRILDQRLPQPLSVQRAGRHSGKPGASLAGGRISAKGQSLSLRLCPTLQRAVRRYAGELCEQSAHSEGDGVVVRAEESIERIAETVGYATGFALSKAFKCIAGVSPPQFRLQATG